MLLLGAAFTVASCRSPLIRTSADPDDVPVPPPQSEAVAAQKLVEFEKPVEKVASPIPESAPAPRKAWYRRMFGGGEAKAAGTDVQPSVEPASALEPAPAAPAPAEKKKGKPVAVQKEKPAAEPVVEKEEPAEPIVGKEPPSGPASGDKRPWYKFWGGRKADAAAEKAAVETKPGSTNAADAEVALEADEKAVELPPPGSMFSPAGEPLIRVGYTLRVSVTAGGRDEMPEQVKTVSDDGEIALPLVGRVKCEGLTLKQASEKLVSLYTKYIRDPQVSVAFTYHGQPGEISPWGSVVVQGYVRQPGVVSIPPTRDLTVSRALQLVGGGKEGFNDEEIQVTRRKPDGTVERIFVNLVAVAKRGESEKDIVLQHGDRILVNQKRW